MIFSENERCVGLRARDKVCGKGWLNRSLVGDKNVKVNLKVAPPCLMSLYYSTVERYGNKFFFFDKFFLISQF